jgi:hypothetical protein
LSAESNTRIVPQFWHGEPMGMVRRAYMALGSTITRSASRIARSIRQRA